jgi:tetratricopeptide (TPR) repeat protein
VLVGASVALVGLALIDQFRYVLVTQPVDAASLEIARALNPNDSRIHHATVKWLIESGRLREASRENSRLLALWPRDVDALINAGVLAQRLGDVDAAATWWRRALVEEDDRADVHLYLAEFLDEAGRPAEAVPHYRRYLELVVDSPTASSDARRVALVLIKFADALSQSGQSDNAATEYTLAAQIAHAAGLSEIEVLAVERIQLPNRR